LRAGGSGGFCLDHIPGAETCSNCKTVILSFSAAGHGKGEVDHVGAMVKQPATQAMCAGEPLWNAKDLVAFLNKNVDGRKGPETIDSVRSTYLGLTSLYIPAEEVNVPCVEYTRVEQIRSLHQVVTTSIPGKLLVRKRGCFSCEACLGGRFLGCTNPDADKWETETMEKVSTHARQVKVATRTRQSMANHHSFLANLATEGSFVAAQMIGKEALEVINVTKAVHEVTQRQVKCATTNVPYKQGELALKGSLLKTLSSSTFSLENAKPVILPPTPVKSAPLAFEVTAKTQRGNTKTNRLIDSNLRSIESEYFT
jgi:hypothetical protein